ncbi:MAG TPA: hypothetical protein VFC94_05105 [Bacteroidaceae bacterium]|nr:hypothetical protein [Bacteroidaceae bacterium]
MKINRLISLGKIFAIAILILGIVHGIATFTPLIKNGLDCLNPDDFKAMIYMSLICGTSFILSGVVLIMLLKKVEQFVFLNSTIMVIGFFLAVSGILSIIYMFDNPFAWIALLLNLSMLVIAVSIKIKLDNK